MIVFCCTNVLYNLSVLKYTLGFLTIVVNDIFSVVSGKFCSRLHESKENKTE